MQRTHKPEAGFTLLEVMIALLVLSLGMAAIASLLTTGVRASGTANLRSIAITHSQTGAEMMRANLNAYQAGWFAGGNTSGSASSKATCGGNNGCSGAVQASNDYADWREKITQSMPDGRGFICVDDTPDDGQPGTPACDDKGNSVIKIFWKDARDEDTLENGEAYHRFVTVVNP